ncbi:MAG TPA: ATP-binding protein [Patescibacteria group bacterium]|nr:ATP-binding protein [Patescibacteria group bacterium]
MNADLNPTSSSEEGLSSAKERLRLALAAGKMGTWEFGLNRGASVILSIELQKILGFEPGRFDGSIQAFLDRVYPSDRRVVRRKLMQSIKDGIDPELEFRFLRQGPDPGWLLARGRLYRSEDASPIRLLGVGIDVTAQKAAELEVMRLNAELEARVAERTAQLQATNKELEAFCYSVSHDLRAPLRSIRGFNEVLLERYGAQLDPRAQEFLRRASDSSRYMDELIESLLKLSRVGRAEVSRRRVDLSQIANTIADGLISAEPGRKVTFKIASGLSAIGDENLLRIVLENLLRNAWKFTSRRAEAHIEFGFADTPEKAFFVRDDGAGFDSAYAGRLFGVFQRLHSSAEFSGTGVGLATVQRVINRHGGRVWATGAVNCGATFYFSLPSDETP